MNGIRYIKKKNNYKFILNTFNSNLDTFTTATHVQRKPPSTKSYTHVPKKQPPQMKAIYALIKKTAAIIWSMDSFSNVAVIG